MKKVLGMSLLTGFLLILAGTTFGASSLITWDATDTTELSAWITQTWNDTYVPILLGLGVAMGFIIIRKVIGVVKGSAR